jgi:hypothetical protein
LEPKYIYQ